MANTDSSDHFFSALENLSAAAAAIAAGDRDKPHAPPYADESILICTLPQTPSSSTSLQTDQTLNLPEMQKRSSLLRKRPRGAKIRLSDSDDEKREDDSSRGEECENPSSATDVQFDLLDFVRKMRKKPNERFADADILEIAAMKGIYFAPPSWWRPGGYDAKKP